MMEAFGLPCPAFMALWGPLQPPGGLLLLPHRPTASDSQSLFAGRDSDLRTSGIPVLMEWGAEFLLMFLTLGLSPYHDQS